MEQEFFLITSEVPTWIILAMAITIFVFASGIVYNLSDRFGRTRWILRNTRTDTIWITTHRFSSRELRRMIAQRGWNSEIIGRAEN
jgi:hypothetical protein